ncbi:MAG: hypothetical protein ACTSRF_07870, partial [Candidatus Freyarchaeota archaeon]
RMAGGLGLFRGLNAPTNISEVSVTAYGQRRVWERRAVFDGFWVATPVPLVEEYAEKAALARDNYYKILNVSGESNLEVLRKDIFEVFAASYTEDFEYLAGCLENFTQHLFPSGEMQEFTGASVQTIYYNTSNSSVPLFVIYSFPEGLENVSLLAAYNYTNIPDVDLSREAVLNASLTELCEQLAQGGDALTPHGLTGEDLAYLPYGAASFVIVNDTVCFDRLSAKPCTIQSVLATIASIAERVWSRRCIAKVVEQEEDYQEVESFRTFINESAYRVEVFKRLLTAVQWVNYMHPMNWDKKHFDAFVDPKSSPYWLSFEYADWGNVTGYELFAECLANVTEMLDFGDPFGAPPVFIVSGEYNRTTEAEGEECVLVYKGVEREGVLSLVEGARQGSVLFVVFNDTSVLNVARRFGRRVNASLADLYVYLAEMAFMYTRPYDMEELIGDPGFEALHNTLAALFSGPLATVEQIAHTIEDVSETFASIPLINLLNTLDSLFVQKLNKKLAQLGLFRLVSGFYDPDWDTSPNGPGQCIEAPESTNQADAGEENTGGKRFDEHFEGEAAQVGPYTKVEPIQNTILTDIRTVFLWPDDNLKSNPILNVKVKGGYGVESQTMLSTPAIISRLLHVFTVSKTRAGKEDSSNYNLDKLHEDIGRYSRERMKLTRVPPMADEAVRQYIFDSVSLFYDPTSTLIGYLDSLEQMPCLVYMGVDSQLSLISYGDQPSGFLSQSITVRNDPLTCLVRKFLLEQTDSEENRLLNDEWLIRMGWAYRDKNGEIVKLIDSDGRITGIILWEMGRKSGEDVSLEVITLPRKGEYKSNPFENTESGGRVYMQTSDNGHITQLEVVYKSLRSLTPQKLAQGEWNLNILKPNKDKRGINSVPYKDCYDRVLNGLMNILGLSEAEKNYVYSIIAGTPKEELNLVKVKLFLSFLDPTRTQPSFKWVDFEKLYEGLAKKSLAIKTSVDREWSDRLALLSILGDSVSTVEGFGKVFTSTLMAPNLLSARLHSLAGWARGNTLFFMIPGGMVPQPPGVETSVFDSGKPTIALIDYANSILTGKSIVVIPIFKEGSAKQDTTPDTYHERDASKSNVPLISRENEFYSNVECYLVYEYNRETGKLEPLWKEGVESKTNVYSKSEYVPASLNEVAGFLKIMARVYAITTSYAGIGDSRAKKFFVSPKYFVEQLLAMLCTKPAETLTIFKDLGGFEALSIIREVAPATAHGSNQAYEGWFARTTTKENGKDFPSKIVENNPDAQLFFEIQKPDYIPTSVDKFILLLSLTGAKRINIKSKAQLPIKLDNPDDPTKFNIGEKEFKTNDKDDMELLNRLGYPIGSGGILFKDARGNPISFTKLKEEYPERLKEVRGVRLHSNLSPVTVRQVFHDAVEGVPPPDAGCEWFEKVSEFITVQKGKMGYYSVANYVLERLESNRKEVELREGYERMSFVGGAIRSFLADPVEEIMRLRECLADEQFTPVMSIVELYLLTEAHACDSETSVMQWFSRTLRELKSFADRVVEGAKQGNIYEVISTGFQQSLQFVANRLEAVNRELQGHLLYAMLRMGRHADRIDEIRPETVTDPLARLAYVASLREGFKPRLDAIRSAVDSSLRAKMAKTTGSRYVYSMYGMHLVAMLKYQGLEDAEIQEVTGFTGEEISRLEADWNAYCSDRKVTETMKHQQFVSVLQQVCQGPTKKALNALMANGLLAGGFKITVGGPLSALHVLPFITVLAPTLQALGFTAVASLEAATLAPLFPAPQNGAVYWGGSVTRLLTNPDANILVSILLSLAVYLTDYTELPGGSTGGGAGVGKGFGRAARFIDMDLVNVILAGLQGGMIDLGMAYVSEDTVADLMKPVLGVVGLRFHPLLTLGFEVAGLVSMLPQMDQIYHRYVWPAAKFTLGAALMGGPTAVITSAVANSVALTALNAAEQAWMNGVLGCPLLQDVTVDFRPMLDYVPGLIATQPSTGVW